MCPSGEGRRRRRRGADGESRQTSQGLLLASASLFIAMLVYQDGKETERELQKKQGNRMTREMVGSLFWLTSQSLHFQSCSLLIA